MKKRMILTEEQIADICKKLGSEITKTLQNSAKLPVIVGVMKGSMNFMMDLVRNIDMPIYTDYIQISSYNGTSSSGKVRLVKDLSFDCQDRTVVIVEDIVDTGYSMSYLIDHVKNHHPAKIYVCSLFDKACARKVDVKVDFVGKVLEGNDFLIGYGLDYYEIGRNIPYVYGATPEDVAELDAILAKDQNN